MLIYRMHYKWLYTINIINACQKYKGDTYYSSIVCIGVGFNIIIIIWKKNRVGDKRGHWALINIYIFVCLYVGQLNYNDLKRVWLSWNNTYIWVDYDN